MTDDEVMKESEIRRQIADRMTALDARLPLWVSSKDRILTEGQILCLRQIAEHNLRGTPMTHNQVEMKSQIHQTLRDAFLDIDRMISHGFIGTSSQWSLYSISWKMKNTVPFDPLKIWKKDFPIDRVGNFVRCLVSMYGDEYAYGLAKVIEEGLQQRTENSEYQVQVRLTKFVRGSSFGV